MRFSKRQAIFNFSISQQQDFLSNKKSGSTALKYEFEQGIQDWLFLAPKLNIWALNYVHMSSYLTNI